MNNKGKIVWSFLLGFVLGGAVVFTGIHFCHHYGMGHPFWGRPFSSKKILQKLSRELDLSAEQKTQVEKILESNLPKFKTLRESIRPQLAAIRQSIQTEIRAVLKPEQQTKFNKLVQDFEKRRQEWEESQEKK